MTIRQLWVRVDAAIKDETSPLLIALRLAREERDLIGTDDIDDALASVTKGG